MSDSEVAPRGLQTRGRRFWKAVTAGYTLNTDERELLVEVCRSLDDCEDLAAAVKRDGLTVAGSTDSCECIRRSGSCGPLGRW